MTEKRKKAGESRLPRFARRGYSRRPRRSGRFSSHSAAGGSAGAADKLLACTLLEGAHQHENFLDQSVTLLDARVAPQRIFRRVQHVIKKPVDRAGGHVQPGVRGAIVNEDLTILARHPTITEHHVGNIADPFLALWGEEVAPRAVGDHLRAVEFAEEKVEHITQSGRRVTYTMRQVQPASGGFDGRGTEAVLHL